MTRISSPFAIFQLTLLVVFLMAGLMRLGEEDFNWLPFINSSTLVASLFILVFSIRQKVKIIKPKSRRIITVDLCFAIPITLLCIFLFRSYYNLIDPILSDFFAVIAFAISLATDLLSILFARLLLIEPNKRKSYTSTFHSRNYQKNR